MAIAQSDGSIILTTKIDPKGITQGLNAVKSQAGKTATAIGSAFAMLKTKSETISILTRAIKDQEFVVNRLTQEYAQLIANKGADSEEAKKLKKQIASLNEELREMEQALEGVGNKKHKKQIESVSESFSTFGKRISGIIKSALIFSVVYRAVQKIVEITKNVAMGNEEFRKSVEELQSALWTMITPLLNFLIPLLHQMVQVLTQATVWIGRFFAAMSGKSYSSLTKNGEALKKQADNYKNISKNAKDAKKSVAGFDQLMILDNETGAGTEPKSSDSTIKTQEIDASLTALTGMVGGALIAIGVLLLFYGQIGAGIGFIIAGAATVGVSIATISKIDLGIEEKLAAIMAVAGFFLFAIGLILLLKVPTAQPLALGMIIAGAGILAVGAAQMAANTLGGEIENMLHGIIAIASGALLAIGLILLFSGQITPLSIGLVIVGAVGLASEVALNGEAVTSALQGWVGGILAIVASAILVIGVVMLCFGIVTPLSIGLVVAGAVGLAATAAINSETIVTALQGWVGELVAIISGALIVLGLILVAFGVLPLGIALIVAGAAGLVTVVAVNKDMLLDWIKGLWESVKEFWNTYIAPVFTKEWWLSLATKAGNGILEGFEGAINGVITMFENMVNWVIKGINKISFDVPDWLGGGHFGFNLFPVSLDRVKIPRLAQGAVIPPNKEFLAVLGDQKRGVNIETPLETMIEAFNIALANNGGGNGGNTTVVIEIDGREFGHAVLEQGQREAKRIGTRLVMA